MNESGLARNARDPVRRATMPLDCRVSGLAPAVLCSRAQIPAFAKLLSKASAASSLMDRPPPLSSAAYN
jgi:hypothetical protein